MKKALKITGIVIGILLIILIAAPFLFQDQIEAKLKETINKNVNAKVSWESLNLSLLRSFPQANVKVEKLSVLNIAPFEGDTLFFSNNLQLEMGVLQLFKSEGISVDDILIEEANVNLLVTEDGTTNYDIAKSSEDSKNTDTASKPSEFKLELQSYEIKNSKIRYRSGESISLLLESFNHRGKGDFSQNIFDLNTHTDSKVSFDYDNTNYLNKTSLILDADLAMDLDQMKFSFKDNKAMINELPLLFEGFVKVNDADQEMDINFKTPESDFKNLLALIPEKYSGSLNDIETQGNFDVNGKIYGIIDDTYIPKLDINLSSSNAMLHYKSLPKQFENINIDLKIENTTGIIEDTKISLNPFSFSLAKDQFSGSANFRDLTENLKADVIAKGIVNLDNLSQAYPIESDLSLNGIINADIETHFDMNSIESERYENIKSRGTLELQNFLYTSAEFNNPVSISNAKVKFDPKNTRLENLDMTTGQTDIKAKGNLENLIGYLVNDKDLKGSFTATSNRFNVNDFVSATEETNTTTESTTGSSTAQTEAFNLPDKLDIRLNVVAKEVIYDNFNLKNTQGQLQLKSKAAYLNKLESNIFGGTLSLDGDLSTLEQNPKLQMDLKLLDIDIVSALDNMEMLQSFTPILKSLIGRFSTELDFTGDLTNDLSPILTSLNGNGLANILTAKIDTQKAPLANQLNTALTGINLNDYSLKNVATSFSFQDGNVNVEPVNFKVEDINVAVQGKHSLNNVMDYRVQLKVPAKYFGDDIGNELAKLTKTDLDKMVVDLPVSISGALTSPKLQLDYQAAVNDLKTQIINQQKDELINQAGDKLNDLLGGSKSSDSTKNDNTTETVKNVLGGLLGGKNKKKNDTIR